MSLTKRVIKELVEFYKIHQPSNWILEKDYDYFCNLDLEGKTFYIQRDEITDEIIAVAMIEYVAIGYIISNVLIDITKRNQGVCSQIYSWIITDPNINHAFVYINSEDTDYEISKHIIEKLGFKELYQMDKVRTVYKFSNLF